MRTKPEPKGAFKKETRTVVDAQRSIRDDSEIDESTKELIVRFMSYLAVDNLKLKTIASYAVSLRKLAKLCPGKGPLYLQRADVQQMILALQEESYQTSTMNLFKARLLRFLRWLREEYGYPADYPDPRCAGQKLDLGEKPYELRGIKTATKYKLRYGVEDLPTQKDVDRMVDVAVGTRNRALVSVLYESGARMSEFLGLKIGSVEHTRYGWKIHIPTHMKTGARPIMLVNSGPYLGAWLSQHPFRDDPNAPLWISTGTRRNARKHFERTGQLLSVNSNSVRAVLQDLGKRAEVKKKLNPHAFRHARATALAPHLKESELRAYMGWTPGSPMPGIYVHLSGRDTDAAILAAYGVSTPDSSRMLSRPKACPACGASNPNGSRMCLRCGQPLDMETAKLADETYKELGFVLPAIAADPKVLKAFRKFLTNHKISLVQETADAPVSPSPAETGHSLSRTAV